MSKILTLVIISEHVLFQILANFLDTSRKFNTYFFLMKKQLGYFLFEEVKEMGNMNKIRTFVIISEHVLFQILVNFLDASRKFNTYIFPMKKQMEDFRLQEVKEMGL